MNYHANTHESTVRCTRCGAQPGELCRSKSGRVASQWHGNREYRESVIPLSKPNLFQRIVAVLKRVA